MTAALRLDLRHPRVDVAEFANQGMQIGAHTFVYLIPVGRAVNLL
jgi:hypothetical protein